MAGTYHIDSFGDTTFSRGEVENLIGYQPIDGHEFRVRNLVTRKATPNITAARPLTHEDVARISNDPIQSPSTRRALASELPPADYTGRIATVNR